MGEAPIRGSALAEHRDVERVIFGSRLSSIVGEDAYVICVVSSRARTPLSAPSTRPGAHVSTEGDVVRMPRGGDDQLASDGGSEVKDVLT